MANHKKGSDAEFLAAVQSGMTNAQIAERFGYSSAQAVTNRKTALNRQAQQAAGGGSARHYMEIKDGVVVAGSDAHFWPGQPRSTAFSAMVRLVRTLNPTAVVLDGDVIDGASISKHQRIGWEKVPTVEDELNAAGERLEELELAATENSSEIEDFIWLLGNHDSRFETYMANHAGQYRGVKGIHLKDHFPAWTPAWSLRLNWSTDPVAIKHRLGKGESRTAPMVNPVKAGTHMVTGHTHHANVYAVTNYLKTLYGVDLGTLSAIERDGNMAPQFVNYMEDNPADWRSAVTVLTFHQGILLPPEQLLVIDEAKRLTAFRGVVTKESK